MSSINVTENYVSVKIKSQARVQCNRTKKSLSGFLAKLSQGLFDSHPVLKYRTDNF